MLTVSFFIILTLEVSVFIKPNNYLKITINN